MRLKFLMLLTEDVSKLPADVELAYQKFLKDFKKETGKDPNAKTTSIKDIRNSRAYKRMISSLHEPEVTNTSYDKYNYTDYLDDKYGMMNW